MMDHHGLIKTAQSSSSAFSAGTTASATFHHLKIKHIHNNGMELTGQQE